MWPRRDTPDPVTRGLLAILHPAPHLVGGHAVTPDLDWDRLWERAETHKVDALVAARVAGAVAGDRLPRGHALPDRVVADARGRRHAAEDRARRAGATLAAVADGLTMRGVPWLAVKGPVLARRVYGDPAARRYYDLDIVVPRVHLAAAGATLDGLGHELVAATRLFRRLGVPKPSSAREAQRFARAFADAHHCQLEYRPTRPDYLHVDLHWRLLPAGFGAPDDRAIEARATSIVLDGIAARTLDPETTALHLAIQAMRDRPGTFRMLPLVDLAWTLHRLGEDLDTDEVRRMARHWGALHHWRRAAESVELLFPGLTRPGSRDAGRIRRGAWPADRPEALVDDYARAGKPGDPAAVTRESGPRLALSTLRWRLGTGDLLRTVAMKGRERLFAARYRLTGGLPRVRRENRGGDAATPVAEATR